MYINPSCKRIAFFSVCCEPRTHPTQLIANAFEITHGHKYLQEWGLSEELCLYEESRPNYAILKKNAPRLAVSTRELLPTWHRVAAAAQMAEAKCMPPGSRPHLWGSAASPGNASSDEHWELKITSMADNCLQRNKSFFKTALSPLTNSRLRFCVAACSTQAWLKKLHRSSAKCHLSQLGGSRGWINVTSTQSIHEPEKIANEICHLLTSARGWPPFQRSVPSQCLPAAETPSGEAPTVSDVEMEGRLHVFTETQWHSRLLKGPWAETVPAYIWTPCTKATLNLAGLGLTFIQKNLFLILCMILSHKSTPWDAVSVDKV